MLFAQSFDIVIKNGKIIDGTGNSWFYGDLGLTVGKIMRFGNIEISYTKSVIDAKGLVVAPGFIDEHAHVECAEMRYTHSRQFYL